MTGVYANGKFLSQKISGVQRYASQLLHHYYQLHQDITLAAPAVRPEEGKYRLVVPVVTTGTTAGLWWEQAQLPFFLRKQGHPLLLNFCNMAPVFYRNKISCIHDIAFLRYPQFFSKAFYYYYKALIPAIIRTSRHVITVSEFSKAELMDYYRLRPEQVTVIPNAGFTTEMPVGSVQQASAAGRPYFLFVGSADPRKNLLFLLKAYAAAHLQQTDLVIAGGGYASFNSTLLQEAAGFATHPHIHFTGHITDQQLTQYYHAAKAVIVPSLYEGFGLPVAEALSARCNVLAADIPIFREVAGVHAAYFDPYDPARLIRLLQQEDSVSRKNNDEGYDYIRAQYSWKDSAELLYRTVNEWR
jgi:glycosyltransferase involved in cell wall biosynthesis